MPFSLIEVGSGGRWFATCVAREDTDHDGKLAVFAGPAGVLRGDRLSPELVVAGRAGIALEDLYAVDPRGGWLALRHSGRNVLLHVESGGEIDLASLDWDGRDDDLPEAHHRALAFDPHGELVAYVRRRGGHSNVVLRTLVTGAERDVTDLAGEPFRIAWEGTGESLVISVVAEDTNQNGRLEWPARAAKRSRLSCPSPIASFPVNPNVGDRPSTFVAPRAGGPARFVPDFVVPFGANVVVRAADGQLLLDGPGGRRALTASSCAGRILHADPERGLLLVACPGKNPQRAAVELVGPGYRLELGVEVQPTAIDVWPSTPERLVPLYPGSDALLVDLDRRASVRLDPGDQVLATSGPRALVRRRGTLVLLDVDQETTKTLLTSLPRLPSVLSDGPLAAVGTWILDLAAGEVIGSVSARPLSLTPTGHALVPQGGPASAERLAHGPLRWERPAPSAR